MPLFGRADNSVVTAFVGKDDMTPVVRGIRATMDGFKRDAKTGFGLAAGFSVFNAGKQVIGELAGFLTDAAEAAMEDERSLSQLTTTLRNSVPDWERYQGAIDAATERGLALAFADDEVRASLNRLLPYTRDVGEALRLNNIAMDLARAKNMSLEDAAALLGKAYSGQVTALRRAGIAIGNTKDSTEALAKVQEQVMGQADAYAQTTEGSYKTLQLTLDEIVESIGYELLPYIKEFATYVRREVIPSIDSWTGSIHNLINAAKIAAAFVPDFGGGLGDAQRHLKQMQGVLHETENATTAWAQGLVAAGEEAGYGLGPDNPEGPAVAVKKTMRSMFKTATDAKAPWRAAMKALAEAGKDPFRDDKFADWMDRRARKFIKKARDDFRNGRGDWRREARALAYVMTNPILRALADTQEEIQRLADAAYIINGVTDTLGNYSRNGSSMQDLSEVGEATPAGGHKRNRHRNRQRNHRGATYQSGGGGAGFSSGSGSMVVNVDGRKLFEIMDARNGRAIAMGG